MATEVKPPTPNQHPAQLSDADMKSLWRFNLSSRTPSQDATNRVEALRSAACALADAIIDLSPHSRERSLALTDLESSVSNAVAAIERNDVPSKPQADEQENKSKDEETKSNG